jgi:hypothetical protein
MEAAYLVTLVVTFLGIAALAGFILRRLFTAQR